RRCRSGPCRASGARWRSGRTSAVLARVVADTGGVVIRAEAPLEAAGGLEGVLGAAGARRVAHRRRGRALVGLPVPPDRAALPLRLDLLGMLLEEFAHEFRDVGFVHLQRWASGTHLRFSGPM